MPPQIDSGDWGREIWDEWASCLPWSPTVRDRAEQRAHVERRIARHSYRLVDALDKGIPNLLGKTLHRGKPLAPWHYKPRRRLWVRHIVRRIETHKPPGSRAER